MKSVEKQRMSTTLASECDSPYLSSIENRRIAKPVLSFSRRLINDENDGAVVVRRASLKRAESCSPSPSVLGLANKKCRLTPAQTNALIVPAPSSPTKEESADQQQQQSPTKRDECEAKIMKAVQLSEQDPDLIGDFSQPHALPICPGKHNDLKNITPKTLALLIKGHFKDLIDSHTIIDGRYPYEFEGGHIVGAKNIFDRSALLRELLDNQLENINQDSAKDEKHRRHVLIFHCEFSSERAPNLLRFLRNKDREYNTTRYPQLYHPEVYLLDGGYKAFFHKFKELCTPQSYLPMLSKEHNDQRKNFEKKSKSEKVKMSAPAMKKKKVTSLHLGKSLTNS